MRHWCALILLASATAAALADGWPAAEPRPSGIPLPLSHVFQEEEQDAPPSPLGNFRLTMKRLKAERDALARERTQTAEWLHHDLVDSPELEKLQARLEGLLNNLSAARAPASEPPAKADLPPAPTKIEVDLAPGTPPVKKEEKPAAVKVAVKVDKEPPRFTHVPDPLVLAQALFRAGNYDDALHAFRLIPLTGLKASERVPVEYMIGLCLRRLGKTQEALETFRKVANSPGDQQVGQCAQWQLRAINWQNDIDAQLRMVRGRRAALEKTP